MQPPGNSLTDNERKSLTEGIKQKYYQYHLSDPIRYPNFDYNTNRVNYEPLRTSFEVEFYEVRGLDRLSSTIHIPSTSTLAMLFADADYVPNKKILNTCFSYAEGPVTIAREPIIQPGESGIPRLRNILVVNLLLVLAFLLALAIWPFFSSQPSDLRLERPASHATAPHEAIVEGTVKNAEIIWLVVHPKSNRLYFVQPAVKVQANNWWISVVFIGGIQDDDAGQTYQIRAFVNPVKPLRSGQMLRSWPKAELSTPITEVTRGKNVVQ